MFQQKMNIIVESINVKVCEEWNKVEPNTEINIEIVLAVPKKTSVLKERKEKETNKEEEEEEDSTEVLAKYVQKHHLENQIIGDKTKGVQTRRKIAEAQE